MKNPIHVLFATFLFGGLLFLSACSDSDDNNSATEPPASEETAPTHGNPQGLIGTSWQLLNGSRDGITYQPPADRPFTFTFESETRLGGFTGCNSFTADYSLDGTAMTIGNIGTTLIGCPEPFSLLEQQAVSDFAGSGSATRNGNRLTLFGDGTTLNFAQQ